MQTGTATQNPPTLTGVQVIAGLISLTLPSLNIWQWKIQNVDGGPSRPGLLRAGLVLPLFPGAAIFW